MEKTAILDISETDNRVELALFEHIRGRDYFDNRISDNGSLAFSVSYSYLFGW